MTGTVLATTVLALGLLFGAIPAQAQTVEMEGDKATAIRDLDLNGVTYDVEFVRSTATFLYSDPPIFDFSNATDARAAVQAVNAVLNAQGNAFEVGPLEGGGDKLYRIGFKNIVKTFGGLDFNFDVTFTQTWDGATPDLSSKGDWFTALEPNDWPAITDAIYADFTIVDTPGSGNQPPTAEAGDPVTGEVDVAVTFDGTGSIDPDGDIVTYTWDFGDDTIVTDAGLSPSHTYTKDGLYNVTLTVTDDADATNSDSTTATIGLDAQPPVANSGGPYFGVVDVDVVFDSSGSIDPDGSIKSWSWDFGDGNQSTEETPSHAYSTSGVKIVALTVTDNEDNVSNPDQTIAVIGMGNLPPTAEAGGPYSAEVGVAVSFDGTGSTDPNGDIVSWNWAFGDGTHGEGRTPSHPYSTAGPYIATLTVTDNEDVSRSDTADVTIDGQPPVADSDSDGVSDEVDNCPEIANPFQEDADGDGLGDVCDADNDNDGLTDDDESNTYGTNPVDADTDNDGLSDGYEVAEGLDPLDSSDCPDWICSKSFNRGWRWGIGK